MSIEGRQINKSAIRNFAIEARNILIKSAVTEAGFYGITKDEIKKPLQKGRDFEVYEMLTGAEKRIFDSDIKRRAALVEAIRQKGFDEVMEETAYTWFNRLIAIRFMEVNNYLPFRMRVLSSDSGSLTPDIVSRSLEVDLNLTDRELEAVQKAKDENSYDEAFRLLFIKVCNELNDILPGLFEKTDDYMELLLKLPYTSDGVVRMLVDTIPESDFNVNGGGQVEIIGWLYQYYNTEPKAKAFAKKGKITKEEIPAVTQLFTPDWIVRYMVENSLGRLWVEHLLAVGDSRSEQEIANDFGWKYYLPEAEQEPEVQAQLVQIRTDRKSLTPEDILCIDPCQGSGHILVYLFEVLMQIYREDGYSERDAARCILEHNLYGLDIDDRAYQLSYFAVLMKARQYDRMILKKHIKPHVYSVQESNSVNRSQLKYFGTDLNTFERNNAFNQLTRLLDTFKDAKEYGSILNVDVCEWELLRLFVENDRVEGQMGLDAYDIEKTQKQLMKLIDIGKAMAQKYHVVTTNPPYRGIGDVEEKLQTFVQMHYPAASSDLSTVFMEKCIDMSLKNGVVSMINIPVWMTLAGYADLRDKIINTSTVISLLDLGRGVFGSDFGTVSFSLRKIHMPEYYGFYKRFYKRKVEVETEENKHKKFFEDTPVYYTNQGLYERIPKKLFAYSTALALARLFTNNECICTYATVFEGLKTRDKERFLRLWFEVSNPKWKKYAKGGAFRRWYGNTDYVVDWGENGDEVRAFKKSSGANFKHYFEPSITYTAMTMSSFTGRFIDNQLFGGGGGGITNSQHIEYILGFVNSCVFNMLISAMKSTVNFEVGQIGSVPFILKSSDEEKVIELVRESVDISRSEWNSYEISWDFEKHPLLPRGSTNNDCLDLDKIRHISDCVNRGTKLEECFDSWKELCELRFQSLKHNEETLNQFFIDLYDLNNELSSEVENRDITVRKADLQREIRSLISYAVGCMFGRYSLDMDGLAYVGGDWKEAYATKYKTFIPDEDAIIPITDEPYFKDDIVERFVDFISIVYGEETLEDNLKFISEALGNRGDSPRAVIRDYFLNDFYKDHCNMYSVTGSGKRPIYWLFYSGKQNGFKALIYIHRYTPDTVGLIRSVYLHNTQAAIQNALQNSEYIISMTTSQAERARETKKRDKYVRQLNELRSYYQALSHIALKRIPLDLDDGVKKNYQLFQGVEISTEGKKKQTIDLLAKL